MFVVKQSFETVTSLVGAKVSVGKENAIPPAVADVASIRDAAAASAIRFMILSSKVNLISRYLN